MEIKTILKQNGITQTEFAAGIGRTDGFVSQLLKGDTGASQETIGVILGWLSRRLGRRVTYEELFGSPEAPGSEMEPAAPEFREGEQ